MFRNRWRRWMRSQPRSSRRGRTASPKPARRCVPALERLETRTVPSFAAPLAYYLGADSAYSEAGAVADFNRDGIPDIVTANQDGSVSVLLGNGDGSFQSAIRSSASRVAGALAVGDFNGDGIPDVVVTNTNSYHSGTTVSVLLGNGDGSLQSPVAYTVGTGPLAVAVADLGNGHEDIVTVNYNGTVSTVSVLLGRGDGTFPNAVSLSIDGGLHSLAVGDFDGDGIPDLAVGGAQYPHTAFVKVLLGNGDGTFQSPVNYSFDPDAQSVDELAVADLNGDGKLDLVATTGTYYGINVGTNVNVLLGNGDGTFRPPLPTVVNTQQFPIAPTIVGDFDGDNKLDLVVPTLGGVWMLPGNGDGTFRSALDTGLPGAPLAAANFTGGGNLDVVVGLGHTEVGVVRGHGDGTFTTTPAYAAGTYPAAVAAGDFSGSGKADLVTVDYVGNVNVLLNNGDGTFRSGPVLPFARAGIAVVVGDFNGDGKQDIAVAGYDDHGKVSAYLGNGDGTFQAPLTFDLGFETSPDQLVMGDFDGDGRPDLAVSYGEYGTYTGFVKVLLGNGDGTFRASEALAVDDDHVPSLTVGDFNGDGKPDLVAVDPGDGSHSSVSVLFGNGDGTFQSPITFKLSGYATAVASADLAGRGTQDLVIVGDDTLSVLMGNGDGTFQSPVVYPVHAGGSIVVGDFNGDGTRDLALTGDNSVSVLAGNGDGTFQSAIDYLVGQGPDALAAGDFNGDGALDLAAANHYSEDVSVLLNRGDTPGPAPRARGAAVNGGPAQGSQVASRPTALGPSQPFDTGALEVQRHDGNPIGRIVTATAGDGQPVAVVALTGDDPVAGALSDGTYTPPTSADRSVDFLNPDSDAIPDFVAPFHRTRSGVAGPGS